MSKPNFINQALKKLSDKGMDISEDKLVFHLKDGSLEIYIDHDEETLKVETHDMKVYTSDELKDKTMKDGINQITKHN
ncbi:phage protein [Staphylococcus aureus]|nr:phage protein [Staphylococcus aureus]